MKSMLNKALLVASLFVVPAIVAADAKRTAEATATATLTPWYSKAGASIKSNARSAFESSKTGVKRAANFVADYTVRTSPAQKFGRLFLAKDGSVSKTKVGLTAAGLLAAGIGSYKYLSNGQYGQTAKWITSPFWGPVHLVNSACNSVWTYAHPSALAKAEKAEAKAVKALAVAEKAHTALCNNPKSTETQKANSDKVVAEAKAALVVAKAEVAKAKAALEALQPKAAALPAQPAAPVVAQPAPVVAQPAAPVVTERKIVQPKVEVVVATPVKSTPVVSAEDVKAAQAEIARFTNARDPMAYNKTNKQQLAQAHNVLKTAGLVK